MPEPDNKRMPRRTRHWRIQDGLPGDLLPRVRWLLLLLSILNVAAVMPLVMLSDRARSVQALTAAGLLWLCWRWVQGYKRGAFTITGDGIEGAILLAVSLGLPHPRALLGILYVALYSRALYGSARNVAAVALTYSGAYVGATVIAGEPALPMQTALQVAGFLLSAVIMRLITVTLTRHDLAMVAQRTLSSAGATFAAAQDRQSIYKTTVETVPALINDIPDARIGLFMGSPDELTAVASSGRQSRELMGAKINLRTLPESTRKLLAAGTTVVFKAAEVADRSRALPFTSPRDTCLLAPLLVGGELQGAIAIVSETAIRDNVADLLKTLAPEAAQALGTISLTEHLVHQTLHDPLTKLGNRTLLRDRLEHTLARTRRYRRPLAVLFIDLDNFKLINDSYGHSVGDQLLTTVAKRLDRCVRASDTVARLGGDEFALLLEEIKDINDAARVAERVLEEMQAPINLDRDVVVAASIGIAISLTGQESAGELLRNADLAMYKAKQRGKSRYEIYEPYMHAAAMARLQLENDLRRSVERGEFVIHYQPIVDLASGRIHGVEALLRWQDPNRGVVLPKEFLSLAEETNLIFPIGRWVFEQVCQQGRRWHQQSTALPPMVAVNLSAKHLQYANLTQDVERALEMSGFPPQYLILECTETVLMQDTEASIARLRALKSLGVQLAIDDFGTGYSSLGYLGTFPIDMLKIAKPFVDAIGSDAADPALVRAIVSLGSILRMTTVAEGIELPVQAARLRALGCKLGQGYHFSKPLEPDQIAPLLKAGRLSGQFHPGEHAPIVATEYA